MDLNGKRIILGSGSPRRRELLTAMNVEFTVDTGNTFEETYDPTTPHEHVPVLMSEGKSLGFHRPLEADEVLITSDTMVLCHADGEMSAVEVEAHSPILGKPHSREDAIRMLRLLSDREHEVITAVTLRSQDRMETRSDSTIVVFKELTDSEIDYYVDNCKPFDKAGAYGIQEWIGLIGITAIRGSYFNVVGFPTHLVYEMLMSFC